MYSCKNSEKNHFSFRGELGSPPKSLEKAFRVHSHNSLDVFLVGALTYFAEGHTWEEGVQKPSSSLVVGTYHNKKFILATCAE